MRALRIALAMVLAALAALATVGSAAAVPPETEFLPPPDGLLDTSCGYEIRVNFPVQREYVRTYFDHDGNAVKVIITGALVVTFTNTTTDESFTANISGPSHINLVTGSNTSEGLIGGPVDGLPGLNVFSGRVDYENGTLHGHLHANVCEVLAP